MSIRLPLAIATLAIVAFAALSLHSPHLPTVSASAHRPAQAPSPAPTVAATQPPNTRASSVPHLPPSLVSAGPTEPIDPAQAALRVESHIATLDDRFVAEPLNADWAQKQERAIRAFFHPGALAAEGLSAPSGVQTVCHSLTCRVSAQFADVAQAEMTTQHLAMHLAGHLPYGAVMPRQLDDGSIQVNAWYSSARIEL